MPMPTLGTKEYEEMVDFMRKDLESNMGYTKIEMIARKLFKDQGKDFDKEFENWMNRKICVVCKKHVDWDLVKEGFEDMFSIVDYHGVAALTENQQVVYEGKCCSWDCYHKLL